VVTPRAVEAVVVAEATSKVGFDSQILSITTVPIPCTGNRHFGFICLLWKDRAPDGCELFQAQCFGADLRRDTRRGKRCSLSF